jgi:hypothetical protein
MVWIVCLLASLIAIGTPVEELMNLVRTLLYDDQSCLAIYPKYSLPLWMQMTTGSLGVFLFSEFLVYWSKNVRINSCIIKVLGMNMAPFETACMVSEEPRYL